MGKISFNRRMLLAAVLFVQQSVAGECWSQKVSFQSRPVNRVEAGAGYEYRFNAVDVSDGSIRYSCKAPSWLHFDAARQSLSGKTNKPGQYAVEITAATNDTMIRQQFMLTVFDKQTVSIWAIGNSITNGTDKYNSYRRELWKLLHAGRYNIDFVGSWDKHHMGGNVPDPDFDMDHDGHSGWTAHHVLEPPDWDKQRGNIDQWLEEIKPDIVLIELGTNDVFQCVAIDSAMKDLGLLIGKLRQKNKMVKIVIAKIPPLGKQWETKKLCGTAIDYGTAIDLFNKAVIKLVRSHTAAKSPVLLVDQFTGIDPATDMYDDIHPNSKGEKKMAQRWYKALQPFLTRLK